MRRISLSPPVLLLVVAGCAKRQTVPTSIPVPLASALIDDRGSPTRPSPKYSVGRLPADYPLALAPTGPVRIIGGMTKGDETVAVFADSTRRLPAIMEQVFEQHGYRRPPPTPGSGFASGSGPYSYFCGDSGTVFVEPLTGPNRAFARVTYRRMRGSGSCRNYQQAPSLSGLELPELKPPAGTSVFSSHGGSGSTDVNSSAQMSGADLDAATILAHYAGQLVSAGWTAEAPAVSRRVAAEYFVAKDTSGASWEGVLMASGGTKTLTVSLDMHRQGAR